MLVSGLEDVLVCLANLQNCRILKLHRLISGQYILSCRGSKFTGVFVIPGKNCVHMIAGTIAIILGVEDYYGVKLPGQRQRCC